MKADDLPAQPTQFKKILFEHCLTIEDPKLRQNSPKISSQNFIGSLKRKIQKIEGQETKERNSEADFFKTESQFSKHQSSRQAFLRKSAKQCPEELNQILSNTQNTRSLINKEKQIREAKRLKLMGRYAQQTNQPISFPELKMQQSQIENRGNGQEEQLCQDVFFCTLSGEYFQGTCEQNGSKISKFSSFQTEDKSSAFDSILLKCVQSNFDKKIVIEACQYSCASSSFSVVLEMIKSFQNRQNKESSFFSEHIRKLEANYYIQFDTQQRRRLLCDKKAKNIAQSKSGTLIVSELLQVLALLLSGSLAEKDLLEKLNCQRDNDSEAKYTKFLDAFLNNAAKESQSLASDEQSVISELLCLIYNLCEPLRQINSQNGFELQSITDTQILNLEEKLIFLLRWIEKTQMKSIKPSKPSELKEKKVKNWIVKQLIDSSGTEVMRKQIQIQVLLTCLDFDGAYEILCLEQKEGRSLIEICMFLLFVCQNKDALHFSESSEEDWMLRLFQKFYFIADSANHLNASHVCSCLSIFLPRYIQIRHKQKQLTQQTWQNLQSQVIEILLRSHILSIHFFFERTQDPIYVLLEDFQMQLEYAAQCIEEFCHQTDNFEKAIQFLLKSVVQRHRDSRNSYRTVNMPINTRRTSVQKENRMLDSTVEEDFVEQYLLQVKIGNSIITWNTNNFDNSDPRQTQEIEFSKIELGIQVISCLALRTLARVENNSTPYSLLMVPSSRIRDLLDKYYRTVCSLEAIVENRKVFAPHSGLSSEKQQLIVDKIGRKLRIARNLIMMIGVISRALDPKAPNQIKQAFAQIKAVFLQSEKSQSQIAHYLVQLQEELQKVSTRVGAEEVNVIFTNFASGLIRGVSKIISNPKRSKLFSIQDEAFNVVAVKEYLGALISVLRRSSSTTHHLQNQYQQLLQLLKRY